MKNKYIIFVGFLFSSMIFLPAATFAQAVANSAPVVPSVAPTPFISAGNTAWMIVATALVMLMTIPGLALFYGGLVRNKNILNVLMQCFILTAVISIEWCSLVTAMLLVHPPVHLRHILVGLTGHY